MAPGKRARSTWLRMLAEIAAIVAGILIALAADAAWDEHIDRLDERQALVRLHDEFVRSAEGLEETRAFHEGEQAALEGLFELIRSAGSPPGSYQIPDSLLWQAYGTSMWTPPRGAVSSLVSSGQIRLIRSDSLRAEITSWLDVVADLNTDEEAERRHYEQFQLPLTHEYVPFVSVGFRLGVTGYDSPSRSTGDYRALLNDLRYENTIEWRVDKKRQILDVYEEVSARLQLIIRLLERELGAT